MPTINKYPVFENNQVLTAGQLNSLASYLDEQTRISRTYLIGTGIVCGLEVTQVKAENKIVISKGTGVTSEGFLISLGKCDTTHFRNYEFPTGVSYPHFMSAPNTMYPIYELLTSDSASQVGVQGLVNFPDANWQNYVVVLFLEIYDKDLYSCLGKSCDEIGIDRILTVRKLLISKTNLQAINQKQLEGVMSPNNQAYRFLGQFDLKHLQMPRAMLNAGNTDTAGEVIYQYLGPVAWVFNDLVQECKRAYDKFELLLQKAFPSNPFDTAGVQTRVNYFQDLFGYYLDGNYGFQYFYDFITDWVMAYNEFCCAASHLKNQCIPNEKTFPLHLMLGEISCPLSPLRQHFVSSPILNEQKEWNEKVIVLYKRIVAMVYGYNGKLSEVSDKEILITPSREKGTRLGERAVPIYYDPKQNPPGGYSLYDVWDEESCLPCRMEHDSLPGYHAQDELEKQTYPISATETPLLFDINNHSFFRIEGHVGHNEKAVRQRLEEYTRYFNLDFETVTLFIGEDGEIDTAKCVFSDLETDYAIWRNKMRFYLTNLIKLTKKAENVTGIKSAVKKEVDDSKEIEKSKDGSKSEFRESASYKGAYWSERMNSFENHRDTGGATSDEEELANRIKGINNCLKKLIAEMPGDLEDFDFERWCDAYRCALNQWVGMMVYIAGRLNSSLNASTRAQFMAALTIMFFVDEVLNFLLIYPYLTIATIHDTVVRRIESLKKVYSLSHSLKADPGLEHMAGVYRGQTFVLIALAGESKPTKGDLFAENAPQKNPLLAEVLQKYKKIEGDGLYKELADENKGKVIGDLSGYVCCCDPCEGIDVDNYNVTPIAFPVTRILIPKNEEYAEIKIQLLNNVYNPDEYEPFADGAQFGQLSYTDIDYDPEEGKLTKLLVYTPDAALIKQTLEQEKKSILIDKFKYDFKNKKSGQEVSDEYIYIFIHAISVEEIPEPEPKDGGMNGTISANVGGANVHPLDSQLVFTVDGANQPINGSTLRYDKNTGVYEWNGITPGSRTVKVMYTVTGQDISKNVTIVAGSQITENFDFIQTQPTTGFLSGKIFNMVGEIHTPIPQSALKFWYDNTEIRPDGVTLIYEESKGDYELVATTGASHTFRVNLGAILFEVHSFFLANSGQRLQKDFVFSFNTIRPEEVETPPATLRGSVLLRIPQTGATKIPPKEDIIITIDGQKIDDFDYNTTTGTYTLNVPTGNREVLINVANAGISAPFKIKEDFTAGTVKENRNAHFNLG